MQRRFARPLGNLVIVGKAAFSGANPGMILATLLAAAPAHAYIDPNVGSQLSQLLYPVLALLAGLVTFARQWLAAMFARLRLAMQRLISRGPR